MTEKQKPTAPFDPFEALTPIQKQLLGNAVKHAGKLIVLGVIMVAFGILGVVAEVAFSYASISLLGALALVSGVFMAAHAFQSQGWKTFLIQALIAVLYIGLGIFVWVAPTAALQGLTIWLAAVFLITGTMRLIASFQHASLGNVWWTALSGVVSIVLGVMILNNWPQASLWVPGLLLAIELLLHGWALVFIGFAMKRASQPKI